MLCCIALRKKGSVSWNVFFSDVCVCCASFSAMFFLVAVLLFKCHILRSRVGCEYAGGCA